jgi:hypothetical protein
MMSKRAAAIKSERASVERLVSNVSFESGGVRELARLDDIGVAEDRMHVGYKKVLRTVEIDFVR